MTEPTQAQTNCGVFITFAGNCKEALTFYQSCFGGQLQFETLKEAFEEFEVLPVVSGSLTASCINIYGSDLVHNEGRKVGNYMAILLCFNSVDDRQQLLKKLQPSRKDFFATDYSQKLIEITDAYGVRWMLSV